MALYLSKKGCVYAVAKALLSFSFKRPTAKYQNKLKLA